MKPGSDSDRTTTAPKKAKPQQRYNRSADGNSDGNSSGWRVALYVAVGACFGVVLVRVLLFSPPQMPGFDDDRLAAASSSAAALVVNAGLTALDWVQRIERALTPANFVALKHVFGYIDTQTVFAGTALGVFDQLRKSAASSPSSPSSRGITTSDLTRAVTPCASAAECTAAEARVARLMEYLAASGVVERIDVSHSNTAAAAAAADGKEPHPLWKSTPISDYFAFDHPNSLAAVVLNFGRDQFLPFPRLAETIKTGVPAYKQEWGMAQFDRHTAHPEVGRIFNRAMIGLGAQGENSAVAHDFDFSPFKHIVEIGAGTGALTRRILRKHPHLNGTLFDMPTAIAHAREEWTAQCDRDGGCSTNVANVGFVTGNFFEAETIPVNPVFDVYILKQIVHDWPDELALRILRGVHDAAMRTQNERIGSARAAAIRARSTNVTYPEPVRVLIVERIMVGGESIVRGMGRHASDIMMLATFDDGARERTESEFRALLREAGFRVNSIVPARGSAMSVIDCVLVGDPRDSHVHFVRPTHGSASSSSAASSPLETLETVHLDRDADLHAV